MNTKFVSCDWGTSNFRIRLVDLDNLAILKELKSEDGVKFLYQKYAVQDQKDRLSFYLSFLKDKLKLLRLENEKYNIVCSGMASSNLGLKELPYSSFPIDLSGSTLNTTKIKLAPHYNLYLVSGVKNDYGMMRGEEVQAIGLENYVKKFEKGVLILPGTHSKHIFFEDGFFTDLSNYMTGELFDVLSKQSILSNSIRHGQFDEAHYHPFQHGVSLGLAGKLTSSLFGIRARHILHNHDLEENGAMLSGLLIGDELSYLKHHTDQVILAAPESISKQYQMALTSVLDKSKLTVIDANQLDKALLEGQKKILNLHEKQY
ncbi:2-dehydro-3-deoxygalactonokinase [Maribacter thermophilus]|uniref:2-dehydro-3-deoxygalactonokinase n=1 Tax=Maribacter thermophilus TaxID=1197874 RepID=UPI0006415494|nr:2-dehydro-3-deoxygalactonokinase [Maribacter thermophilus]